MSAALRREESPAGTASATTHDLGALAKELFDVQSARARVFADLSRANASLVVAVCGPVAARIVGVRLRLLTNNSSFARFDAPAGGNVNTEDTEHAAIASNMDLPGVQAGHAEAVRAARGEMQTLSERCRAVGDAFDSISQSIGKALVDSLQNAEREKLIAVVQLHDAQQKAAFDVRGALAAGTDTIELMEQALSEGQSYDGRFDSELFSPVKRKELLKLAGEKGDAEEACNTFLEEIRCEFEEWL
jgi:hypothetical protein